MRKLDKLVEGYRSFMKVKFSDKHVAYKAGIQIQSVIGCFVMSAVFLMIGIFTNQIKSLYYVFFMMNTIIIGSFVLNKISLERKIQAIYKITYDYRGELLYQTATLTGILSIAQSLLILFQLPTNDYMFIFLFLLVLSGFSIYITRYIYFRVSLVLPHRILKNGLLLYLLLLFSRYAFGKSDFSISYIIMFGVSGLIYFIKYLISLIPESYFSNQWVVSLVFILVIFGFSISKNPEISVIFGLDMDQVYYDESTFNIVGDFQLQSSETWYTSNFLESEDFIFFADYRSNELIVYDKSNYDLLETIEFNDAKYVTFRETDDVIYVRTRSTESVYNEYNDTYFDRDFIDYYYLDDSFELVHLFRYDFSIYYTFDYITEEGYFTTKTSATSDEFFHQLYQYTEEDLVNQFISLEGPDEIILQNDECVYYRKDNLLKNNCNYYQEGYIIDIVQEDISDKGVEYRLYTMEDFMNDGTYVSFYSEHGTSNGELSVSEDFIMVTYKEKILRLHKVEGNFYETTVSMETYYILDKEMNLIDRAYFVSYGEDFIDLIDNQLIANHSMILSPSNPTNLHSFEYPIEVRNYARFVLLCMIPIGSLSILPKGWWMD